MRHKRPPHICDVHSEVRYLRVISSPDTQSASVLTGLFDAQGEPSCEHTDSTLKNSIGEMTTVHAVSRADECPLLMVWILSSWVKQHNGCWP